MRTRYTIFFFLIIRWVCLFFVKCIDHGTAIQYSKIVSCSWQPVFIAFCKFAGFRHITICFLICHGMCSTRCLSCAFVVFGINSAFTRCIKVVFTQVTLCIFTSCCNYSGQPRGESFCTGAKRLSPIIIQAVIIVCSIWKQFSIAF